MLNLRRTLWRLSALLLLVPLSLASATAPSTGGGNWGMILPKHRIVAYYGNPLSGQMGILGRGTTGQMISQLASQAQAYAAADPAHPVQPALELVTVVAQRSPGPNHAYSVMMPKSMINKEEKLALAHHYLLILDVQVGHGTVQQYVKALRPYLVKPNVELALDPEFDMAPGKIPGVAFGRMYAKNIDWAAQYLSGIAKATHQPQKLLIVHEFFASMLPDWYNIRTAPHVALIKDIDGFGHPANKIGDYQRLVSQEQTPCLAAPAGADTIAHYNLGAYHLIHELRTAVCGGFKLFYRQDTPLLSPAQVLQKLNPPPLFIVYQ